MLNLFKRKCYFCNQRTSQRRMCGYYNDAGKKIRVCEKCVPYAERRVFLRA